VENSYNRRMPHKGTSHTAGRKGRSLNYMADEKTPKTKAYARSSPFSPRRQPARPASRRPYARFPAGLLRDDHGW